MAQEEKNLIKHRRINTLILPQSGQQRGMLITDAMANILFVDRAFCNQTGYKPNEIVGKNPCWSKTNALFYRILLRYLHEMEYWHGEIWVPNKNGEFNKNCVEIKALKDIKNTINQFVVVFLNSCDQSYSEQLLGYIAQYDELTGLPNRLMFDKRLSKVLTKQRESSLAVLFLDIDRLKTINNTLGYSIGDLVLQTAAQRLVNCVGIQNTVARLGGDEFLIMLEGISGISDAVKVAHNILGELSRPLTVDNYELFMSGSIGISLYPNGGENTETLIKNAETAMDRVKEQGRNRCQVYVPAMNDAAFEKLKLYNDLRKALDREEFQLYYQPQVELMSGSIIGLEALLRWQHPELGLIYPNDFIPIAEETGFIVDIGEWALMAACAQGKAWQEAGVPPVRIAVNISARQFQRQTLVETISRVLKRTGFNPKYLELEITETITMQDIDNTLDILNKLRKMKIPVSVDDFGIGYCSLIYLKKYPIDKLKIDKSFIKDVNNPSEDNAIVQAIIAMAQSLGLKVIAEGVETCGQIEFLRKHKCYGVQGYLIGKPVSALETLTILQQGIKISEVQKVEQT